MSIDSDIASYQAKIRKINNAIPDINGAISSYQEALIELKKMKNIARCEVFKRDITTKVTNLKNLITKMKREITTYENKIRQLREEKAAQESCSGGGSF